MALSWEAIFLIHIMLDGMRLKIPKSAIFVYMPPEAKGVPSMSYCLFVDYFAFTSGGYELKGIYILEEYYAKDLPAYYAAMTLDSSHNYYEGRAETDIIHLVDYFLSGILHAFKNVKKHLIKYI